MTKVGDRIRLLHMDDPDALPAGATGKVTRISGEGEWRQIDVAWEPPHSHRTLSLVEVDRYEVITP